MISRRCATASTLATAVLAATVVALAPAPPATAATRGDDGVRTTITSLTPTALTKRSLGAKEVVRMTGRVTNTGTKPWTDAQAYLVIRPAPLTSRGALAATIRDDPGFAGPRVVETGLFDEVGDLPVGATRDFSLSIPASRLPISGADGVYPVGVQILATDSAGRRDNDAVSRAVTLLPRVGGTRTTAPTTVVWPFLMPSGRSGNGTFTDATTLITSIRPGGRLRTLLDLALARGDVGRGVVVDPALVLAADDLAEGRGAGDVPESVRDAAATFRDDLVSISTGPSAWVLDFDRTDVLGLSGDAAQRRRLFGTVERATDSVVRQFGLSRQRVSWPATGGVTRSLLSTLRARGDDPVIVNSSDLSRFRSVTGPLVDVSTSGGDLPLLVNDDITTGLPGALTGATLRQEVLSSAAFAALSRDADPDSRAAAVVVVDPFWNPRRGDPITSGSASWTAPFSAPTDLDALTRDSDFTGAAPASTGARRLPAALVDAADRAYRAGQVLRSAGDGSRAADDARARSLAGVLGLRYRTERATGTMLAQQLATSITRDLDAISVMGPPSVTLSSSQGAFPLTITNQSTETVSVGVRLSSSNPALQLPDQDPVEIAAGERLTLTVDVDLRQQNATTVTAQLITPDGRAFGSTSEFNVRSSRVGVVLWVTMAAAGLFVLLALARRFLGRRRRGDAIEAGPADE